MSLMGFMETMGTSSVPLVAAFFIGLMMALSPCPLATNVAAIGYLSRRIGSPGQTILAGALYSAGRMAVYVGLAALLSSSASPSRGSRSSSRPGARCSSARC